MGEKSRLRRTISRWADIDDQHARDLRATHAGDAPTCISEAADRSLVTLGGTIKSLTVRPRGGVPALEAELDDGSGTITIIWLGRRRIAGIDPGRALRIRGRIGTHEGRRVIHNPRYELRG